MQVFINIIAILIFILVLACVFFLKRKGLLQDSSTAETKPYSFSRVQVTWWTVIIIGSFLYIFAINYGNPTNIISLNILNPTALILLGISAGTLGVGRIIDAGQENKDDIRHQNSPSEGFLTDILSDDKGISIHRFQCLIFNLIYGLIFIYLVLNSPATGTAKMPDFKELELTLMGISSATYIGLKAAENTTQTEVKG